MLKTYRVHYMDTRYQVPNVKLLEADCVNDVMEYMADIGLEVLQIEEE